MPGTEQPLPKCRGCGAAIIWATLDGGGAVPLDPRPIVYRVDEGPDGRLNAKRAQALRVDRRHGFAVSHFATCPKANDFGRNARRDVPRGTSSALDHNGMGREP